MHVKQFLTHKHFILIKVYILYKDVYIEQEYIDLWAKDETLETV